MNSVIVCCLLAAVATEAVGTDGPLPDVVPVAPKQAKEKFRVGARKGNQVDTMAPASAPVAEAARDPLATPWLLAFKLGGGLEAETPLAGTFGAAFEFAYRLPALRRILGFGAAISAGGGIGSVAPGQPSRAMHFALAPLLSAQLSVGPGQVRAFAGPRFAVTVVNFSDTQARHGTSEGLGALAGLGYGFRVGPGALGLECAYALSPYAFGSRTRMGHSVSASLFYAWSVQ